LTGPVAGDPIDQSNEWADAEADAFMTLATQWLPRFGYRLFRQRDPLGEGNVSGVNHGWRRARQACHGASSCSRGHITADNEAANQDGLILFKLALTSGAGLCRLLWVALPAYAGAP
jgi:hypothetical protein